MKTDTMLNRTLAAGRGDQEGPLGVVLALDVDKVLVHVGMLGEVLVEVDGFGVHVDLAREEAHGLGQAAHRMDIESFDDGGLGRIGSGARAARPGLRRRPGWPSRGCP